MWHTRGNSSSLGEGRPRSNCTRHTVSPSQCGAVTAATHWPQWLHTRSSSGTQHPLQCEVWTWSGWATGMASVSWEGCGVAASVRLGTALPVCWPCASAYVPTRPVNSSWAGWGILRAYCGICICICKGSWKAAAFAGCCAMFISLPPTSGPGAACLTTLPLPLPLSSPLRPCALLVGSRCRLHCPHPCAPVPCS